MALEDQMQLSALIFSFALLSASPPLTSHAGSARVLIAQSCHPSYQGECVPITSDADCASGTGNGPAYVRGPVQVVGPDEYDLDRDGDGVGCEN
jgi:hypothetical protein